MSFQARLNATYKPEYCCSDPECCMPSKNNFVGQLATREFNVNPRLVKQYRPPSIQLLRQEQLFLSPGQRPPSVRTSTPRPLSQRTPPSVRPLSLAQPTSAPRPTSQRITGVRTLPNNTNPLGPGGTNQGTVTADKVALWESINRKQSGIVFDQPGSTPSPGSTSLKRSQSFGVGSLQKTILENQRIANERLLESERFRMSLRQAVPSPIQPPPPVPPPDDDYLDAAQVDQRSRSRSSPGYLTSSPTSTVTRLSTPSPPRPIPIPPPPLPPPIPAPSTPPLSSKPDPIPVPSPSVPTSNTPQTKYGKNPPWAENRLKGTIKPPPEEEKGEFSPPPPPKEAEYGWSEQEDLPPLPPQSLELENIYQALQSFHYASDVDLTRIDPESLRDLFLLRDSGLLTTAQFVAAMERLRVSCLSPPGSPTKTIK